MRSDPLNLDIWTDKTTSIIVVLRAVILDEHAYFSITSSLRKTKKFSATYLNGVLCIIVASNYYVTMIFSLKITFYNEKYRFASPSYDRNPYKNGYNKLVTKLNILIINLIILFN